MLTTSYLDRILDPVAEAFTPEVAQRLVDLQLEASLISEIENLREKANVGTLSAEEASAYKELVEAIDIVGILQAKARKFLSRRSA